MSRLTYRNGEKGKSYLKYGLDAKWSKMQRYDVLDGAIQKLAEYEDAEEQGLLPRFHLGDEFWTVHWNGVQKEKIVMLQQKKDGTWKYRFPNTADYTESDYGKYFFDTKEEAEQKLEEMNNNFNSRKE